ncbi:MAG: hypothetical protein HYW33_00635 [Candidatus Blackburnbacteria bacterium]|nr:hypothetical protein [Candidatus Blackburnbacteria bacterium]
MKSKKLKFRQIVEIVPTSPFHFDSTFHKPDHFPSDDNYWEPGKKWQTWNFKGECLGLEFQEVGNTNNPKIEMSVYSPEPLPESMLKELTEEVKYRYNLDLDLRDFYGKFENNKILGPIIKKWRGMRPGHPGNLYTYLIIGIILQNTTVKRSISMLKTLFENYGTKLEFVDKELYCFWNPGGLKDVSEQELRDLKLGYRAKSIKIIDEQFGARLIDETKLRNKDRDAKMKELLKIYGVGPATVWYLLFDVFHHFDFFNHISPWEQKIYSKVFFGSDPENPVPVEKLIEHFEKYAPYQQLAVHYIWENLWWKRKNENIPWLEKLIRI